MKARVKATGEIVEVEPNVECYYYKSDGTSYWCNELDFDVYNDDYWEKLKHQYAGMAMQGMLSNDRCWEESPDKVAEVAICYAKELIKGLKLERSN